MVRNDQHRQPLADVGGEQVEQSVDLPLEARRDVVDRDEQGAGGASSHCRGMWSRTLRSARHCRLNDEKFT